MSGGAKLAALIADDMGLEYFCTERLVPAAAEGLFPVRYVVPAERRASLSGKAVAIVEACYRSARSGRPAPRQKSAPPPT